MIGLTHFFIGATAALLVWALLYEFMPWTSKLIALYGLHDLRDRVYDIRYRCPELCKTLVYRDSEFLMCVSINVVRERDYRSAIGLAATLLDASRAVKAQPAVTWRREQYAKDFSHAASIDKTALLIELIDLALKTRRFVLLRALLGHPGPLTFALASAGWAVGNAAVKVIATSPMDAIVKAVSDVESRRTPEGGLRDVGRLLSA